MSRPALVILLTGLMAAPTGAAPRPESPDAAVHALVERVVHAYGGREALARVKAYRLEGTVFSMMRHAEVPTVRVFQRPDRFKALIDYEDGAEARLASGQDVWRNEPGGPLEPARGPMRAAVLLQAMRADVPWIMAERESLVRIDGDSPPPEGVFRGAERPRKLLAISLPAGEGLAFRAWIGREGRVVVSQGVMDHGGMQTHFETVYSDFRDVGGVRFAFHEENWASGVRTGFTTVKRIVLNPEIRDDEFEPPRVSGDGRGD